MKGAAQFKTLDKDLGRISNAEAAQLHAFRPVWRLGLGVLALVGLLIALLALGGGESRMVGIGAGLVVAAWLGLAIGSNDVANSLGPAVGAGAIRLLPGLLLVAAAGLAGAVLAGAAVSQRLAAGIVAPELVADAGLGPLVMLSALIGAASWITLATGIGLPVSTSHSIVGGIAGAGAAAVGLSGVAWPTVGMLALVWIASPVASGLLAGLFVILLRVKVVEAADRAAAAHLWLPSMVSLLCALFAGYVVMLLAPGPAPAGPMVAAVALAGAAGWISTARGVAREVALAPRKPSAKRLLAPALVVAVTILGFAHGANDVGNVAGPLSVIIGTARGAADFGQVPLIALIGAGATISLGTLLFGGRLVNMVGSGITKLNAGRAFCVSLATGLTVLTASGFGLPVSTTHVAVGGVFGVGFAREWLDRRRRSDEAALPEEEVRRRRLIRRSHVATIMAAWMITLPTTAALGAAASWLILRLAG